MQNGSRRLERNLGSWTVMKRGKGGGFWHQSSVFPACPTHTADLGFPGQQKAAALDSFSDLSKVMVCEVPRASKPKDASTEHRTTKSLDYELFLVNKGSSPPAKAHSLPVSLVLFPASMWTACMYFCPPAGRWPRVSCLPLFVWRFVPGTFLSSGWLSPCWRVWSAWLILCPAAENKSKALIFL